MPIKIVTDSTSDLPPEVARELDIEVVPLKLRFGLNEYRDGIDISADEFYSRLVSEDDLPTTSQPSVGDFTEVYKKFAQSHDAIVSIHPSAKLSGTYNSAMQAAESFSDGPQIVVIDSQTASMGLGTIAIVAAKAGQSGASFDEVTKITRQTVPRSQVFVTVNTLEYLVKGGRIGKARALVGGLLNIKPMLIVRDGEVHELGKERSRRRALTRLKQVAYEFAPVDELSVVYSTDLAEAENLASEITDLLPQGNRPHVARFGPVLGTYVGPGAIGIGLIQQER